MVNIDLGILRYASIIIAALTAYFLFRWVQEKKVQDDWLHRRSIKKEARNYLQKMQDDALAAGVQLSAAGVIGISLAGIAGGYLVVFGITGKTTLSVLGAIAGLYLPKVWQARMIEGRRKAFNLQLEQVLNRLTSCLQAGMNFSQSLNEAIQTVSDPAREIFNYALSRIETGDSPSTALKEASKRVRSRDMEMFSTAVSISEPLGGDLGMVLARLEESLRDQRNFKEQLSAATAEGSMTAWVMAAMPFLFVGFLRWSAPELMDPLFNTFTGNIIFVVSFAMIIFGVFQIKQMTDYDN
jgi:tight adherence protein B